MPAGMQEWCRGMLCRCKASTLRNFKQKRALFLQNQTDSHRKLMLSALSGLQ